MVSVCAPMTWQISAVKLTITVIIGEDNKTQDTTVDLELCKTLINLSVLSQTCVGTRSGWMCELHNNHTHQGESGPGLDPTLLRAFQLQQDSEHAHGRRRMYPTSAPSPESAREESKGMLKNNAVLFISRPYITWRCTHVVKKVNNKHFRKIQSNNRFSILTFMYFILLTFSWAAFQPCSPAEASLTSK